jgi:hypothetical protein
MTLPAKITNLWEKAQYEFDDYRDVVFRLNVAQTTTYSEFYAVIGQLAETLDLLIDELKNQ